MRYTGHTIARTVRLARAAHAHAPTPASALALGKLLALRALYETTIYARIALPGLGEAQRTLREAVECHRLLRKLGGTPPAELRRLRRALDTARRVPCELPDVDFTA